MSYQRSTIGFKFLWRALLTTTVFSAFFIGLSARAQEVPSLTIGEIVVSSSTFSGVTNPLSVVASDTESTLESVIFYYTPVDSSTRATIGIGLPGSDNSYSANWDVSGILDGEYELSATALNEQGQMATSAPKLVQVKNETDATSTTPDSDTTEPLGSIVSPPDDLLATTTIDLTAQASDNEGGSGIASVSFYLDGVSVPIGITTTASGDLYSFSWSPEGKNLADGEHNVYAIILDRAGNSHTTSATSFRTDTTLPTGTISYSTTAKTRNNVTATISNFNRPVTITNNDGASTYTFTDNGTLTFSFTDSVGHTGTAVATVANIDRTAPQFSGFVPADGSSVNGNTQFRFTDTKRTSPRCSTDGLNYSGCGSLAFKDINGFNNLPQGPFVLYVKDLDSLGNLGTAAPTFIKDTIAPTLVSATVTDARTVVAKFSEGLETDTNSEHYLGTGDFWVISADDDISNPVNHISPSSLVESDGLVTLHFDQDIATNTAPSLVLILNPVHPESIADLAGNEYTERLPAPLADGFSPVILSSETEDPNSIVINFSEPLKNTSEFAPQTSDFNAYAVRNGSVVSLPISSISVSGENITVNIGVTMYRGDFIHLGIKAGSQMSDISGNLLNRGLALENSVSNRLTNDAPSSVGGGGGGGTGINIVAPVGTKSPVSGKVLGAEIFRFTRDLKFGQTSADIKELQKKLMSDGFMATTAPTAFFGAKTLAGVKKYQKAQGLPVTGFVGPMTRAILNGTSQASGTQSQIDDLSRQISNLQNLIASFSNRGAGN